MRPRIAQPRVDPSRRASEQHSFTPALLVSLLAITLVCIGSTRSTGVQTVQGARATETQLVKAFSSGGIQYASQLAATPPPRPTDDPVASAAALERWAKNRETDAGDHPDWRIRVDPAATTPCPT